jgi:hypothetical protein
MGGILSPKTPKDPEGDRLRQQEAARLDRETQQREESKRRRRNARLSAGGTGQSSLLSAGLGGGGQLGSGKSLLG